MGWEVDKERVLTKASELLDPLAAPLALEAAEETLLERELTSLEAEAEMLEAAEVALAPAPVPLLKMVEAVAVVRVEPSLVRVTSPVEVEMATPETPVADYGFEMSARGPRDQILHSNLRSQRQWCRCR